MKNMVILRYENSVLSYFFKMGLSIAAFRRKHNVSKINHVDNM